LFSCAQRRGRNLSSALWRVDLVPTETLAPRREFLAA
jgi:hypothetical protein